ncbi:MAG: RNA methyltransferase [Planctomycetota bacterium]|nr:RNA methyltransferase [Planctomycetota bacterium]
MDSPIQSTKNPLIRRFRAAAQGEAPGLMVAEGRRLVLEALGAGRPVVEAAWSPRLLTAGNGQAILDAITAGGRDYEVHECSDKVLGRLSLLSTHQGISLVLRRPQHGFADLLGDGQTTPLLVVASGVRDPGNLGALVRSAEAAGATGMLVVEGSADPYRDKALRGSAGSVFRLPVLAGLDESACIESLQGAGLRILVAADLQDARHCWDVDLTQPTALVVGAEGSGIPQVLVDASHDRVVVPLVESVESLNVAVAAGVLLFEARRQRR